MKALREAGDFFFFFVQELGCFLRHFGSVHREEGLCRCRRSMSPPDRSNCCHKFRLNISFFTYLNNISVTHIARAAPSIDEDSNTVESCRSLLLAGERIYNTTVAVDQDEISPERGSYSCLLSEVFAVI